MSDCSKLLELCSCVLNSSVSVRVPVFFICYYVLFSSRACVYYYIEYCCVVLVLEVKWVYNCCQNFNGKCAGLNQSAPPTPGLYVWLLSYQEVWPWRRYVTRGGPVSLSLCLSAYLCLSFCLCVCVSACLPACLPTDQDLAFSYFFSTTPACCHPLYHDVMKL